MLRLSAIIAAVIGLAGCEIASPTPLLDASAARAILPDFTQRFESVSVEGHFGVITALEDGKTINLAAFETSETGNTNLVPPSFQMRFYPIDTHPRFSIAELILPPEFLEADGHDERGYGLVSCDQNDKLVTLYMGIPAGQQTSATDDRFIDERGQLNVSSADALYEVFKAALAGSEFNPIDVGELPDTISCTDLFSDPL